MFLTFLPVKIMSYFCPLSVLLSFFLFAFLPLWHSSRRSLTPRTNCSFFYCLYPLPFLFTSLESTFVSDAFTIHYLFEAFIYASRSSARFFSILFLYCFQFWTLLNSYKQMLFSPPISLQLLMLCCFDEDDKIPNQREKQNRGTQNTIKRRQRRTRNR